MLTNCGLPSRGEARLWLTGGGSSFLFPEVQLRKGEWMLAAWQSLTVVLRQIREAKGRAQ